MLQLGELQALLGLVSPLAVEGALPSEHYILCPLFLQLGTQQVHLVLELFDRLVHVQVLVLSKHLSALDADSLLQDASVLLPQLQDFFIFEAHLGV